MSHPVRTSLGSLLIAALLVALTGSWSSASTVTGITLPLLQAYNMGFVVNDVSGHPADEEALVARVRHLLDRSFLAPAT